MELFSELYGCYFGAVARILQEAHNRGLTRREIDDLIARHAFTESPLQLTESLLGGDWDLLEQDETGLYRSKLQHADTGLPLTTLQKRWLRAVLDDRRIGLFLDREALDLLREKLADLEPLYLEKDFLRFDVSLEGDDYRAPIYIQNFRLVLEAIHKKQPLRLYYDSVHSGPADHIFLPWRLQYSPRDDRFRVLAVRLPVRGRPLPTILLMQRILQAKPSDREVPRNLSPEALLQSTMADEPVILRISKERNALERTMLHFASYRKQTVPDGDSGHYLCHIWYDRQEETELLIRILSFGPVVQVLGPESFLQQVRQRVRVQTGLLLRQD